MLGLASALSLVFDLSHYTLNAHALPMFGMGAVSLILGVLTFRSNRKASANRHFLILCLSISAWLTATGLGLSSTSPTVAVNWFRIDNVGVMFISVSFYSFSAAFLSLHRPRSVTMGYVLAGLLVLLVLLSGQFVVGVRTFWWGYFPQWGPASLFFFPVFTAYMAAAFADYFRAYRRVSAPLKRQQILYVMSAFLIAYTGSVDFLPAFGIEVYPFGYIPIFLLIAVISYAIIRYRLMDITVVINKGLTYALATGAILIASSAIAMLSTRASEYSIPPLLSALLVIICGSWVALSNPRATTNISFGLVCGGVALWLTGCFMLYSSRTTSEALFWSKVVYGGVVWIPAALYHFCVGLSGRVRHDRSIGIHYLLSLGFLGLVPTSYFTAGTYQYFWGYYPKAGPLHPAFLLYFFTVCGRALKHLYQASRLDRQEATQLRQTFWAFLIGMAASSDFVPSYGIEFYPLGYMIVGLWIALMANVIVKHELMQVSFPFSHRSSPLYAQLLGLPPAYLGILTLVWLFTGAPHYLMAGALLALFIALAGILANLQQTLEDVVGQRLFRARYDAYDTLVQFSKSLVSILDLESLTREVVGTLTKVMNISTASVYVLDSEKSLYILTAAHRPLALGPLPSSLKSDDGLPAHLALQKGLLVREELEYGHGTDPPRSLLEILRILDAEVCIPLINKERLVGFCNLGARADHAVYSGQDLSLLMTLGQHAAIALDNALLYEDLKRSQALMRRTDRLRSLETIAGGFAHEIRNPLTSIKTFIQLVPDRRDDQDFVEKFSEIVVEDVRRIERLIQEILDYARYMEPKLTEENLNDIVASCLYFIQVKASAKSIRIERDFASDLPPVTLDRQQIKQVLLNLFINAMDAMAARGGCLSVKTHLLRKLHPVPWVQIEVSDTGAGIASENLDHIFDPFYTTKHASGEHEGTGLGLTIVHQIVHEHRGYIEVKSEVGKGTTFFVNLPASPEPIPSWNPQPWPLAHQ